MNALSTSKAVAAGVGLALVLGQAAQAGAGPVGADLSVYHQDARVVADEQSTYRLLDQVQAALGREGGAPRIVTLARNPDHEGASQLCGIAVSTQGQFSLLHVADARDPGASLSVSPVARTLNGLAVAHNDVYAQCGGFGRAVTILDRNRLAGAASRDP